MNTSTTTIAAMARDHAPECSVSRSWALTLAVVALLGLAVLGLLGAEFGTAVHAAADTARAGALEAFASVDAVLAGIRWVR